MTLKEALKKAAQAYFDGEEYSESNSAKSGGMKYTKKFFDDFARSVTGEDEEDEEDGD